MPCSCSQSCYLQSKMSEFESATFTDCSPPVFLFFYK
uniref:Uncharacterized protein n=1 Tax=Arundo donax TaxID=35708 RepID=A0A0A8Z5U0_ARUDO